MIILCGGGINHANLPIATQASNAMVPLHGKPVIGWILDDLISKGFNQATIVLQVKNRKLHDFLKWAYNGRFDLKFAFVEEGGTILDSLDQGLQSITEGPIHILLGDTLIKDDFQTGVSAVYVGEVSDQRKWCMVRVQNQVVTEYADKPDSSIPGAKALAGYYRLANVPLLKRCLSIAREQAKHELSSVLTAYGIKEPIYAMQVHSWFDFGNLENFVASKLRLFQSRHFNSIEIDGLRGVLIKRSSLNDKLRKELTWYLALPEELRIFSPRILERDDGPVVKIVQEYYGYPNLAELFLFGELNVDIWLAILDKVLAVHQLFSTYKKTLSLSTLENMYLDKTSARLQELTNPFWIDLLARKELIVNGKRILNYFELLPQISRYIHGWKQPVSGSIIHGDYCFSNILFDVNNSLMKVVDPRGSFGDQDIHGDPRYDIAKLRHSIEGLYDYIVADLFTLHFTETDARFSILSNDYQPELVRYFDEKIVCQGYSLNEIKLIEGLLFISMVPLHADHPTRQKIMYLKGIELLNEALL